MIYKLPDARLVSTHSPQYLLGDALGEEDVEGAVEEAANASEPDGIAGLLICQ